MRQERSRALTAMEMSEIVASGDARGLTEGHHGGRFSCGKGQEANSV